MTDLTNLQAHRHNQHVKVDIAESVSFTRARNLINDVMGLLSVRRETDILPRISELLTCEKGSHSNISLIKNLSKLIADCSPEDKFEAGSPTNKEVWRWVRNLMKKYMEFTKHSVRAPHLRNPTSFPASASFSPSSRLSSNPSYSISRWRSLSSETSLPRPRSIFTSVGRLTPAPSASPQELRRLFS